MLKPKLGADGVTLTLPITALYRGIQPRPRNDESDVVVLARDLKRRGVLSPLCVYKDGGRWCVFDGHRRLAACRMAKIKRVPICVVKKPKGKNTLADVYAVNSMRRSVQPGAVIYAEMKSMSKNGWTYKGIGNQFNIPAVEVKMMMGLWGLLTERMKRTAVEDGWDAEEIKLWAESRREEKAAIKMINEERKFKVVGGTPGLTVYRDGNRISIGFILTAPIENEITARGFTVSKYLRRLINVALGYSKEVLPDAVGR